MGVGITGVGIAVVGIAGASRAEWLFNVKIRFWPARLESERLKL